MLRQLWNVACLAGGVVTITAGVMRIGEEYTCLGGILIFFGGGLVIVTILLMKKQRGNINGQR